MIRLEFYSQRFGALAGGRQGLSELGIHQSGSQHLKSRAPARLVKRYCQLLSCEVCPRILASLGNKGTRKYWGSKDFINFLSHIELGDTTLGTRDTSATEVQ